MTTILLTTTVNVHNKAFLYQIDPQERLNMYLVAVKQWLQKTQFNIILVENSGYLFPELAQELEDYKNRFEIISFNETLLETCAYLNGNNSKGASELFAIHYAIKNSYILQNNINFIIKITGRFFIPELEEYLKEFNMDEYDGLTQNNNGSCEMVGSHIKNIDIMFNPSPVNKYGFYEAHVEIIYQFRGEQFSKMLRCKQFQIVPTIRGGCPREEPLLYI